MHSFLLQGKLNQASEIIFLLAGINDFHENPNVYLIDQSEAVGIDLIRDIQSFLITSPSGNDTKVVIINNAETLTPAAQHALLKTLEEPPTYVKIFLICTNTNNLLGTIQSRTQLLQLNIQKTTHIASTSKDSWSEILQEPVKIRLEKIQRKKKDQLKELCDQWLSQAREMLIKTPCLEHARNCQIILDTMLLLNSNVNPQLSVERMLYSVEKPRK